MYFPFKSSKKRTNIDVGNENIKDEFLGVIFEKSDENVKKSALIALKVYNHSFLGQIYPSLVLFIFMYGYFLEFEAFFRRHHQEFFSFTNVTPRKKSKSFKNGSFSTFY